jgi:hypothetical protein
MTKTPELDKLAEEYAKNNEGDNNYSGFIAGYRAALTAKMPEWPTEKELNEERKRFYREMGKFSGMSDTEIERQIDFIGWHVWIACYQWLKERLCVE